MANDYRVSLTYPNPSLGQLASLEEPGSQRPDSRLRTNRSIEDQPVTGVRQVVLIISLDTSIVSTSLVTISHDLDDFINAPWIVLAYMLTYMGWLPFPLVGGPTPLMIVTQGFAVCISKLSDIYGRRNLLALSWVLFIAFSLGCASAKDMVALIVCRAFQGVGASGLYSLTQIGLVEVGPVHRPSLIGAMVGATLAVAFVLGPLIGGVVSQLSDWRWLFNMNIPFGLVTILAITNLWPHEDVASIFSWNAFTSIDFIGSATLLLSSGLLVFAVQQAGSQTYAWSSPEIISSLVISAMSWGLFVWWQILLESKRFRHVEPIFPIRLMLRRVYSSGLLITLLTGFPYISLSIVVPERFQIVDAESVLMAGVHILPMLGACATGSFLGGAISSKRNNTSFTLVAASCLQVLGVGLLNMVSGADDTPASQYGYQAIFGLGVGLSFSGATIMTNILASEHSERAAAQGAVAQARVLGGCIGLSACTVIFNSHVNRDLQGHLTPGQLEGLHRSPLSGLQLPHDQRELVQAVYAGAFAEEIKVLAVVCAVMVVISLFTLERHPAPLERLTTVPKDEPPSRRGSDSGTEMNDMASVRNAV